MGARDPDEAFERYLAAQRRKERRATDERGGIPEAWRGRRRRRVDRPAPNFAAEEAHVIEFARMHCGLWSPRLTDLKRLRRGRTAHLVRDDRSGATVMLITDRSGTVVRVGTALEFRETPEALHG